MTFVTAIRKRCGSASLPTLGLLVALCASTGLASPALADSESSSVPSETPASTETTTSAPAPIQVAGRIRLVLQHVHGRSPFALLGESVRVRGIVIPYVARQKISVRFSRDGRPVRTAFVKVVPVGNGAGQFHITYASPKEGVVRVAATHAATPEMAAFRAKAVSLRFISAALSEGARGPAVRLLQSQLAGLHFAVPRDGVFGEGTGRAVIAYRKMTGLARVPSTDARVFHLLGRGAGTFRVRFPHDGRHVEADLSKQVLAEIEPGGHVRRLYTVSSGKPSTPTVLGHFQVYSRTPGTNSEGMVDSSYFIRGYAIHGYVEVPTYAASHGCLRVPIPDALAIYDWVRMGMDVDVYN